LKPFRVAGAASDFGSAKVCREHAPDKVWLEYAYRKSHPVLQFLPTKLAEWIGENMQDELGFPDKRDPNKWSVSELNDILRKHLVRDRNLEKAARYARSGAWNGSPSCTEESCALDATHLTCRGIGFTT